MAGSRQFGIRGPIVVTTALALSAGWGIRGNFGHEFGAMIPGAFAALALVLMNERRDWRRRFIHFAMLGALGWSFGGSISYMQVIAYTHSGHSASVLYGFACLFVIGFLWAALGGAGTALAAQLDRRELESLYPATIAVIVAWVLQPLVLVPWLRSIDTDLNWFDTDWLGASTAAVAVLLLAVVRRKFDTGTNLVLAMAGGWWVGFLALVVGLGLRMTPPRGDNWAGCLGMTLGVLLYAQQRGWRLVLIASWVTGILGGIGFAAASMLKLVEVTSGADTNWHSLLEQTTGLFNGAALAAAMGLVAVRAPKQDDTERPGRWTDGLAAVFVLWLIPWVNLRKNPRLWVEKGAVPEWLAGLPTTLWYDMAFGLILVVILAAFVRHLRKPLPMIPTSATGRTQLVFLTLLWVMVIGNFERALVGFQAVRLVTEGVIHLNAALLSVIVILASPDSVPAPVPVRMDRPRLIVLVPLLLLLAAGTIAADWAIVRALYGDRHAGHSKLHIRFGPNATTAQPDPAPPKPAAGATH